MKKKFVLSLYPLNSSPEKPTWQACDMYGPFENNNQAMGFLNRIDPQGRTIKNALIVEGEMISRESGRFTEKKSMLTTQ